MRTCESSTAKTARTAEMPSHYINGRYKNISATCASKSHTHTHVRLFWSRIKYQITWVVVVHVGWGGRRRRRPTILQDHKPPQRTAHIQYFPYRARLVLVVLERAEYLCGIMFGDRHATLRAGASRQFPIMVTVIGFNKKYIAPLLRCWRC